MVENIGQKEAVSIKKKLNKGAQQVLLKELSSSSALTSSYSWAMLKAILAIIESIMLTVGKYILVLSRR